MADDSASFDRAVPRAAVPGSAEPLPSWAVGVIGVAAVASALFSILMFLNR